jgi:hypothetical protein
MTIDTSINDLAQIIYKGIKPRGSKRMENELDAAFKSRAARSLVVAAL